VDEYFGTSELAYFIKGLRADYKHETILGAPNKTTPKNYALFKIAEGCDRSVHFVPYLLCVGKKRGHRSILIEDLVTEAN